MAVSGQDYVDYLKQFIGTPYVWGGQNPGGFDCSGLLVYGAKHFGLNLGGRTTYEQIGHGEAVNAKGLRVGDLVFFDTDGSVAGPDHVGVYAGNGQMLHAPRPGKSVELADMTGGYWMGKFMGGRRINGVVATGGGSQDFATPQEKVKLTKEELAASYGWAIGFMESNPELKKLFKSATDETWTAQKFQAEVRNTNWWKTTSEKARQAQALESSDPATYRAQVEATRLQVELLAAKVGASIPPDKMNDIINQTVKFGLEEGELRLMMAGYIQFTRDGTLSGEAGMHEYVIKEYAIKQGVKMDEQTIKEQAQLVVKKLGTVEEFKAQIRENAKSAFPGYSEQIDAGVTVKDLASPFQTAMAKMLELPSESIKMDDPIIRQAMNGTNKEGKPIGLTLSQFQNMLRSDPRWKKTSNAQDAALGAASKVLKDMGLTG